MMNADEHRFFVFSSAPFTGLCPALAGYSPGLSGLGDWTIIHVKHALARFVGALA